MRIRARLAAFGAAALILGGGAAGALAANAGTVNGVTPNTAGEAGYYVNETSWHIRDAHAVFTVTPAMKSINGNSTVNGAVGAELCDPNTGFAAQVGLLWTGTAFQVGAENGTLPGLGTVNDPCIQSGILSPVPEHSLLGDVTGGDGTIRWPGTINVGDKISIDVYYNPTARYWRAFQYTACDVTQDVCRQAFDNHWPLSLMEAGIGVQNSVAPQLTSPALNPLVTFSSATFTNYNKSAVNRLFGGWDLREAVTINGAGAPTLQPSTPVGNSFSIAEGSASA